MNDMDLYCTLMIQPYLTFFSKLDQEQLSLFFRFSDVCRNVWVLQKSMSHTTVRTINFILNKIAVKLWAAESIPSQHLNCEVD